MQDATVLLQFSEIIQNSFFTGHLCTATSDYSCTVIFSKDILKNDQRVTVFQDHSYSSGNNRGSTFRFYADDLLLRNKTIMMKIKHNWNEARSVYQYYIPFFADTCCFFFKSFDFSFFIFFFWLFKHLVSSLTWVFCHWLCDSYEKTKVLDYVTTSDYDRLSMTARYYEWDYKWLGVTVSGCNQLQVTRSDWVSRWNLKSCMYKFM